MSTQNGNDHHEKVIIIGSGPAGYTAAIYAARAELKPLMFSGIQPGGQLMITTDVENYPGYPEGIMGPQMMEDFRKQAERFGTPIQYEEVTRVDLNARLLGAGSNSDMLGLYFGDDDQHFDFNDWRSYRIGNERFEELGR